jgi:ribonuclease III
VPDLAGLQKTLGITFKDSSLLKQALVHSSYTNENPVESPDHNEKLEFLGDAVLDLFITEELYRKCPGSSEGEMTRLRAALVNGDELADIARKIQIGENLYMGKGEESSGGRDKKPNLAGALEAVIAAVYLDRGVTRTRKFILKLFREEITNVLSFNITRDYKSRLQELIQSQRQVVPVYRLVAEEGPDHDKTFTVEVRVGKTVLGRGVGKSKKQAEATAARLALEKL